MLNYFDYGDSLLSAPIVENYGDRCNNSFIPLVNGPPDREHSFPLEREHEIPSEPTKSPAGVALLITGKLVSEVARCRPERSSAM